MKSILFFFALTLCQGVYSQSNYVSTFLVNPEINATHLVKLPWDETRLYQITVDTQTGFYIYTIDDVSNGTVDPVTIPLCSDIRAEPTFLNDGILLSAITSYGLELVYFDGVNSTIFDLNQGTDGSDADVFEVNHHIFVLAFDGNYRQLYEFNKITHTITKITTDAISVRHVCAELGDAVYYSTYNHNAPNLSDEYELLKATPNGGSYSFSTIQAISVPTDNMRDLQWRSAVNKWNVIYFSIVNVHMADIALSSTIGVIAVDPNDQVSTINLTLPTNSGEFHLVDGAGALWIYSSDHDFLYNSTDGVTFNSETIPTNITLIEHYVTDNDQLYFKSNHPMGEELFRYENGLQSKHVGEDLHLLLNENDMLYIYDYSQNDSSSIVLVYAGFDIVEEVFVNVSFHSPYGNSAVIYNGLFTFLFTNGLTFFGQNDIFQLTGSPQAGVDELSVELNIYPNPVSAGEAIFIETTIDGVGEIVTADGRVVSQLDLNKGTNVIETSSFTAGVYFISVMNRTHRIVVN